MKFHDDYYSRRLIDPEFKKGNGRVAICLLKLSSLSLFNRHLELVPGSYHGDEQGMECEAIFRHGSGAYLLYARHMDSEQLDISIPKISLNPTEIIKDLLRKDLEDLLVTELPEIV